MLALLPGWMLRQRKSRTLSLGEGHSGSRVSPSPTQLRLLVHIQKQMQALYTIRMACYGDLGVNTTFLPQVICALHSSSEGSPFFPILLPKKANLEQTQMQAGKTSYPGLGHALDGFRAHMHQQNAHTCRGVEAWGLNDSQLDLDSVYSHFHSWQAFSCAATTDAQHLFWFSLSPGSVPGTP